MSTIQEPTEGGHEETVQVLTFVVAEQEYYIHLKYATEIIDGTEMTSVPSTPEHIEGVMHLRGQTTTIVDLLVLLEGESIDCDELPSDGGEVTPYPAVCLYPDRSKYTYDHFTHGRAAGDSGLVARYCLTAAATMAVSYCRLSV